ncbi:hypothetical protein DVR12_17740 [Chitinophaga silvatica]|uniref:Uncharacterized protein n=1 Tax=Chitinophaga silvatica TaxID=2282649 RepID=A0A3E1Y810_9BACT|nr:hypothetical protein DVR12_17740 [Chitinophaga silvatica]
MLKVLLIIHVFKDKKVSITGKFSYSLLDNEGCTLISLTKSVRSFKQIWLKLHKAWAEALLGIKDNTNKSNTNFFIGIKFWEFII